MKSEELPNSCGTVVGDGLNFVGDKYNVLRIDTLLNTPLELNFTGQWDEQDEVPGFQCTCITSNLPTSQVLRTQSTRISAYSFADQSLNQA